MASVVSFGNLFFAVAGGVAHSKNRSIMTLYFIALFIPKLLSGQRYKKYDRVMDLSCKIFRIFTALYLNIS